MKDFEISDIDFKKEDSDKYCLAILLARDGFTFSITSKESNKLLALKHRNINVDNNLSDDYYCQFMYEFIVEEEILKLEFNSVNVVYITGDYTLIPKSVYEQDQTENIFYTVIKKKDFQIINVQTVNTADAVLLYSVPECLTRIINRYFSNVSYFHPAFLIIENAYANVNNDKCTIYIHQEETSFDVCILNKGNMLVYNTFKYSTSDDIIYYSMFLIEQYSLKKDIDKVILSGQVRKFKEFIPSIKKFFPNIDYIIPESRLSIPDTFDNIQLQDFNLIFMI